MSYALQSKCDGRRYTIDRGWNSNRRVAVMTFASESAARAFAADEFSSLQDIDVVPTRTSHE